eukprot:scaffold21966_cov38-Attheya_sp.AAC.3
MAKKSSPVICGHIVSSRRGLLAFIWSIITLLTFVSLVLALVFASNAQNANNNDYNNYDNEGEDRNEEVQVAVTSRAMVFAALWTAVLASIMSVFGTVILGFQSPTGQYYICCSGGVHQTTPLSLGTFIGALLMDGDGNNDGKNEGNAVRSSSMAFAIVCIFLTIMYFGFAAAVFLLSGDILEEAKTDAQEEALRPSRESRISNNQVPGKQFGGNLTGSGYTSGSGGYVIHNDSDTSMT